MKGDWVPHYFGWHFFRVEPWHWPPGVVAGYYAPLGTSIGLTDSIPLAAYLLKPLGPWLPARLPVPGAVAAPVLHAAGRAGGAAGRAVGRFAVGPVLRRSAVCPAAHAAGPRRSHRPVLALADSVGVAPRVASGGRPIRARALGRPRPRRRLDPAVPGGDGPRASRRRGGVGGQRRLRPAGRCRRGSPGAIALGLVAVGPVHPRWRDVPHRGRPRLLLDEPPGLRRAGRLVGAAARTARRRSGPGGTRASSIWEPACWPWWRSRPASAHCGARSPGLRTRRCGRRCCSSPAS